MSFLICWSWLLVFKRSANFSNYTIQMLTGKFKLRCFPYNKTLILCTDSTHSFRSKLPKLYFSQLLPLSVGRGFFLSLSCSAPSPIQFLLAACRCYLTSAVCPFTDANPYMWNLQSSALTPHLWPKTKYWTVPQASLCGWRMSQAQHHCNRLRVPYTLSLQELSKNAVTLPLTQIQEHQYHL